MRKGEGPHTHPPHSHPPWLREKWKGREEERVFSASVAIEDLPRFPPPPSNSVRDGLENSPTKADGGKNRKASPLDCVGESHVCTVRSMPLPPRRFLFRLSLDRLVPQSTTTYAAQTSKPDEAFLPPLIPPADRPTEQGASRQEGGSGR